MPSRRRARLAAVLAALLLSLIGASQAPAATVSIYLLQGEQLAPVERVVPDGSVAELAALQALLAGPTDAERAAGLRTAIPRGTQLLGYLRGTRGVTIVDVNRAFTRGGGAASRSARLSQLVYTVTELQRSARVRLWLRNRPAKTLGTDTRVARPLGRVDLEPAAPPTEPPTPTPPPPATPVRDLQTRLRALGYLPEAMAVDGVLDQRTVDATVAFQKWERLSVDGIAGPQTRARLKVATRPSPAAGGPVSGRRVEIDLARQVLMVVRSDGVVARTIHISTGRPATPTPTGAFTVFRREPRSWSVPFQQWLTHAAYFTGGIAMHGYATVPTTPGSHGCVRIPLAFAPEVYAFAELGTPVVVR